MPGHDIIVIGASAGGLDAIRTIARGLPAELPASLFFVLHTAPHDPFFLPELISKAGSLPAQEAKDGAPIEPGKITVAPPDRHLLLEPGRIRVLCGPKENNARPAIDPLFRSAARTYGPRVIGVVLTGNLDDGSAGLLDVKERGGLTVVQDPEEALYPSMPRCAKESVKVDYVAPLGELAPLLGRLALLPSRPEEAPPVPERLDLECRIMTMDKNGVGSTDRLGKLSGLTCPDCRGVLTRIEQENILRFRCHEGHAYSARSVRVLQEEIFERGLGDLIRLLEERASLHADMAEWSRKTDHSNSAERWESEVLRLKEEADRVRAILIQSKSVSPLRDAP